MTQTTRTLDQRTKLRKKHGTFGGAFLVVLIILIGAFYLHNSQKHHADLQSLAISVNPTQDPQQNLQQPPQQDNANVSQDTHVSGTDAPSTQTPSTATETPVHSGTLSIQEIIDTPTPTRTYIIPVSETENALLISTHYKHYIASAKQSLMHTMHDLFHPFYIEGTSIPPPPPVYLATIESNRRHLHYAQWIRQGSVLTLDTLSADTAKEELAIDGQTGTTYINLRHDAVSDLHEGLSIRDRLSAILSVDTNF